MSTELHLPSSSLNYKHGGLDQVATATPTANAIVKANSSAKLDSSWLALQMSVTSDASGVKLSGDSTSPGINKVYGTDGSGVKGWKADPTGGVTDGDKGDVTVSSSGSAWTIDNGVVTYAKIQDVSATDKVLGRSTAGSGSVEEIACTSAGRSIIGAADAAAQYALLTKLTTQGDILTRGASADQRLAVGARDYALVSNGSDPAWSADTISCFAKTYSNLFWYHNGFGMLADFDVLNNQGTPATSAPDANQCQCITFASGTAAGNNAGCYGASHTVARQNFKLHAVIRVVDTTSIRMWISLHDGNSTSGTGADDPASRNLIGFRFSTDASDTNWRCCTKDGTTLNNQDSGVAPSTSGMTVLSLEKSGSSVVFSINGTVVQTLSSNLPTSTALLRLQIVAETRTTAAKNIKIHSASLLRGF